MGDSIQIVGSVAILVQLRRTRQQNIASDSGRGNMCETLNKRRKHAGQTERRKCREIEKEKERQICKHTGQRV